MIWDVHPGSGSRFFSYPGFIGPKSTGSRIRNPFRKKYLRIQNTAMKEEKIWYKIGTNLTLLLSGSLLSGKDSGRDILDVPLLHITGPGKGEKYRTVLLKMFNSGSVPPTNPFV
jgi:hypothetical protein